MKSRVRKSDDKDAGVLVCSVSLRTWPLPSVPVLAGLLRLHVLLYSLKNFPRIHYQQYVFHPCGISRPVRHRFLNNVDMYVTKFDIGNYSDRTKFRKLNSFTYVSYYLLFAHWCAIFPHPLCEETSRCLYWLA